MDVFGNDYLCIDTMLCHGYGRFSYFVILFTPKLMSRMKNT
jgi:hypothetical protein